MNAIFIAVLVLSFTTTNSIFHFGPGLKRTVHTAPPATSDPLDDTTEENLHYWKSQMHQVLKSKMKMHLNTNVAKNVILFVGDGMSIATLAAARMYYGRKYHEGGEEVKLSFEKFPYTGLSKTYCLDSNVAESACSAMALLAGVKVNSGTLGLNNKVKRGECAAQQNKKRYLKSIVHFAQAAGKATGIVTTTRLTDATPAAAYAHSADRLWETDIHLPIKDFLCTDIASQLVKGSVGKKLDVILGGGKTYFLPNNVTDEKGNQGSRRDRAHLIKEWYINKIEQNINSQYVYNKDALLKIDPNVYKAVLGIFAPDHMPYHLEAQPYHPSLMEMTHKAVEVLSTNNNGYFLLVEAGKIDLAHHENKAHLALDETVELAKAVEAVVNMVDLNETLLIVTADHSHTMTYSGYSKRKADILGLAALGTIEHFPHTILSYANGPGFRPLNKLKEDNLELLKDTNSPNHIYPAFMPLHQETHAGEDVAVFAIGPWAHLFTGNYDQNFISHAMRFASCLGPGDSACNELLKASITHSATNNGNITKMTIK